jgi:hypothetical protein
MHEFSDDQEVQPFDFGAELPGGLRAHEVDVICPDETALHSPALGVLAVADGVINYGGLRFVGDEHLGDDPGAIKQGLRDAYAGLLDLEFDTLLLAHGDPLVGGAKDTLRAFAEG